MPRTLRLAPLLLLAAVGAAAEVPERPVAMVYGAVAPGQPVEPRGAALIVGAGETRLYLATADHVLTGQFGAGLARIEIELRDLPGERFAAWPVEGGRDRVLDLAFLAVDRAGLPDALLQPAPLADPERLLPGDGLVLVGFADRTRWHRTAEPEPLDRVEREHLRLIRRHARAGHSGGGAFDRDGRLAGMTVAVTADHTLVLRGDVLAERARTLLGPVGLAALPPVPAGPRVLPLDELHQIQRATALRSSPSVLATTLAPLRVGQTVRVVGRLEGSRHYLVRLPDGTEGLVGFDDTRRLR
jgi:hypothetical protein